MSRLLHIVGLFATFAALFPACAHGQSYEELCDLMIAHAQQAARAHNMNKFDLVEEHQQKVSEMFEKAVALDPSEPQAYLNMATYQSNSHQYDESIANFDKVLEIFAGEGGNNEEMIYRIEQAKNIAYYKKYSKLRDTEYDSGEGNATKAHEYALKQLEYSPEPHRTNHQVATLEAMLCEYDRPKCAESHTHFRIASFATFQHVTKTYSERLDDKLRMHCFHSQLHLGVWAASRESDALGGPFATGSDTPSSHPSLRLHPFLGNYPNNTREDLSASNSGIYANTLRGVYDIHGPDGIIVANMAKGLNRGDCNVFVQNGDYYVNLADNLFPNPTNSVQGPVPMRPPPSARLPPSTKILSLVHFASTSFYHWMAEALPKLIYFRQTFPDADFYKLLIPSAHPDLTKKKALPSFVRASLKLLGIDVSQDVIGYSANSGLTVDSRSKEQGGAGGELVAVTWDPSPCPGEDTFAEDISERRMCASLTPFEALRVARNALSAVCLTQSTIVIPEDPYVVVVGRGKDVSSRGLNTTRIAEALQIAIKNDVELLDNRPIDTEKQNAGAAAPLAPVRKQISDDGRVLRAPEARLIRVMEFKSDEHSFADALRLFKGASLVVGPHGGALANIMACEEGKTSVLEIGLQTVAAQHYKHMAIGLGLRYRRLVAGPDRLRRALNAPTLIAKTDIIVKNAVELLLGQLGNEVAVRRTQIPSGTFASEEKKEAPETGPRSRLGLADEVPASSTSYTRPVDEEYIRGEEDDEDEDDEL